MIEAGAFVAFVLIYPLLLNKGEKRYKIIQIISPIIICYATGLLLANQPFFEIDTKLVTTITEVAVPLAIPLLLFSTDFSKWIKGAKVTIISFGLCVLAVTIMATIGAFAFQDNLNETWKLAGMMVGVYTGGTPNMSAVGMSLDVSEETFILLNASDLVWGAIYLFLLMTLVKPLLAKILPPSTSVPFDEGQEETKELRTPKRYLLLMFIWAVVILGSAVGLSVLFFESMNAIFILLFVTSVGIGLSFNSTVHSMPGSYRLGDYFLLVFCLSLGCLADVSLFIASAAQTLLFTGFVMFGAIILHVLLAYLFKIDRDTVIITSVAGIYGPAFVGPIAKVLNNRNVVLAGMTTGLVGYAVGNYLGIGLALLLKQWF
jgi:uncharacterized membrane protein